MPESLSNSHPTAELLRRLGNREFQGAEADAIRAHVESCAMCRQQLQDLDQLKPGVVTLPIDSESTDSHSGGASLIGGGVAGKLPERVGRYRLEQEIARGGMGQVVRVTDEVFQRPLAMKIALRHGRQRFIREALITGQLQHPGIPPVQEMGQLEDGRPYFIMKLVKGSDLGKLLRERSSPSEDLPRFIAIFEHVCQTLGYAHSHGLIHRDLKPGNIMVGAFGEVQVMDWGLAKLLTQSDQPEPAESPAQPGTVLSFSSPDSPPQETVPGTVMGTSAFMPPEQARGEVETLDTRCDVFGLGAILCVVMTGEPPFAKKSSIENQRLSMKGDLSDAMARLDACGEDAELINLAKRCLAPNREDRPMDAGKVAEAIAQYQAAMQERMKHAEIDKAAALVKVGEERKRRRVSLALAATIVLLLMGVSASAFWYQGEIAHRQIKERLQARGASRAHLEELEGLIAQLERRSPEEAASARREVYQRYADALIEDLRQPQLGAEELARIDRAIEEDLAPRAADLADMVGREFATGFKKTLDARLPNVELTEAYLNDVEKLIATIERLHPGYAREARSALYSRCEKLVLDSLRRDKTLTLEDFARIDEALAVLKTRNSDLWNALSKQAIDRRGLMQTVRIVDSPFENLGPPFSGALAMPTAVPVPLDPKSDGFVALFNGKDLSGWTSFPSGTGNWQVVDGNLTCHGTQSYLFTKRSDFKDFHFRIEARVNAGGNSGQFFRCQFGPGMPQAYFAQINNSDPTNGDRTGSLRRNGGGPGGLFTIKDALVADDAWFTQEVIARGNHIQILLNGKMVVDMTDRDNTYKQGHLALEHFTPQTHIEFRRVEIKEFRSDDRVQLPDGNPRRFLLSPTQGIHDSPVLVLKDACRGNVQMEATFAYPSWGTANQLGLLLNTDADARRGYAFTVQLSPVRTPVGGGELPLNGSGKNQKLPATLEAARETPGVIALKIERSGVLLRQEMLRVQLLDKPLTLRATREGSLLSFDLLQEEVVVRASISFDDVFATSGGTSGFFALNWPSGVGLQSLYLRRQTLPPVPGQLQPADQWLADGEIEKALALYRVQAANEDHTAQLRQEARCKEALCLLRLGQEEEAAKLLSALFGELSNKGERWPLLAACELWQLRIRKNKWDDADDLARALVALNFRQQLASCISEETWKAINASMADEFSAYTVLVRPSEKRMRNLEHLVDLFDALPEADIVHVANFRYRLCRAYRIIGQCDKAQAALEKWLRGNMGEYQSMFLEELGWTYRELKQPQKGLEPIRQYLRTVPATLASASNRLFIELARLNAAMGNWEEAERDLDKYFAAVSKLRDDYVPFAQACLIRGFLHQRRGDSAGAQAAWTTKFVPKHGDGLKSYSLSDPVVASWPLEVLHAWVLGSLTSQLTDDQAQLFFQQRIINSLPKELRQIANAVGFTLPSNVLRDAWRTPHGLEAARHIAFLDVGLNEYLKLSVVVGAYAAVRESLPADQKISAEQDDLFWQLVEEGWSRKLSGKLTITNLVQLTFTWKGNTDSTLGWGALAKDLQKQPELRGPLAYFIGFRMLRLGKPPREALEFFRMAQGDATAGSSLRRLAETELERLKAK